MFNINFANDWIRTADLWCRKRPLYQLSHNHCPRATTTALQLNVVRIVFLFIYHFWPLVFTSKDNLRSRRRSSARAAPVTSLKRKTTKPRLGSRKRSKSVKVARATSDDSHQLESFSDIPERPLIPKEPSSRNFLVPPAQKRIPKITFKAQSFEYDDSTEVHTVQVSKQHSSIGGSPWVRTLPTVLDPNCAIWNYSTIYRRPVK